MLRVGFEGGQGPLGGDTWARGVSKMLINQKDLTLQIHKNLHFSEQYRDSSCDILPPSMCLENIT